MNSSNDILLELCEKIGLDVAPADLASDRSIQEIGMDSLSLIKLLYVLEDDFGVTLKTSEMFEINTVGDLRTLIASKLGRAST